MNPTCREIATVFDLWGEYADPDATMTEAEFAALTTQQKVDMLHEMFPLDCHCEEATP